MGTLLAVGLGGFLGAISRYGLSGWASRYSSFPLGTLGVNVLGCFLIGVLYTVTREKEWNSPQFQAFLGVGFLGSLTTFSTFGFETLELLRGDRLLAAFGNVLGNVLLGLLAVASARILVLRFFP